MIAKSLGVSRAAVCLRAKEEGWEKGRDPIDAVAHARDVLLVEEGKRAAQSLERAARLNNDPDAPAPPDQLGGPGEPGANVVDFKRPPVRPVLAVVPPGVADAEERQRLKNAAAEGAAQVVELHRNEIKAVRSMITKA